MHCCHQATVDDVTASAGDAAAAAATKTQQQQQQQVRVLERADAAKQTSLQAVADVDPMEGEQTWPTQEELADAEGQCQVSRSQRTRGSGSRSQPRTSPFPSRYHLLIHSTLA